jgi:hypothetical protein
MTALDIITHTSGINIGPSKVSISTVGVVPGILRLADHPVVNRLWLRVLSWVIDTVLLTAGVLLMVALATLRHPGRLRFRELLRHLDEREHARGVEGDERRELSAHRQVDEADRQIHADDRHHREPQPGEDEDEQPDEQHTAAEAQIEAAGSVQDVVAAFQRSAGAQYGNGSGGGSSAPAQAGDDMQIAAAARAFLAEDGGLQKAALKDFSPAEQKQIIDEGAEAGVVAANLASLDIAGTHYESLEAAFREAEAELPDEEWLY